MQQIYYNALGAINERLNHYGIQLSKATDQYEIYYYRALLLRNVLKRNRIKSKLDKRLDK